MKGSEDPYPLIGFSFFLLLIMVCYQYELVMNLLWLMISIWILCIVIVLIVVHDNFPWVWLILLKVMSFGFMNVVLNLSNWWIKLLIRVKLTCSIWYNCRVSNSKRLAIYEIKIRDPEGLKWWNLTEKCYRLIYFESWGYTMKFDSNHSLLVASVWFDSNHILHMIWIMKAYFV